MKKFTTAMLTAGLLVLAAPLAAATEAVPPPPDPAVTEFTVCADGSVVALEEECPEWVTLRRVLPDGTIVRRSCRLQAESRDIVDWDWVLIPTPIGHVPIPIPVTEVQCHYGKCGDYRRDDLIGDGGPAGNDS